MFNMGSQMPMQPTMNPYDMQPRFQQPSPNMLIRVTGIEGAKAYQMAPNSTVALFDNNDDYFYVKTTDGAGFPTIRTFKFEEVNQDLNKVNQDLTKNYVSREEMEAYVQQFIQKSNTKTKQNSTTNTISE